MKIGKININAARLVLMFIVILASGLPISSNHCQAVESTPMDWDNKNIAPDSDISEPAENTPELSSNSSLPTIYPFSGAATQRFPIQIPPGRGDATPQIALIYNSLADNGRLGMGWDLKLGSIRRMSKHGMSYSSNQFEVVTANGATELVRRTDWAGGEYYGAKIENKFTKYLFNPSLTA